MNDDGSISNSQQVFEKMPNAQIAAAAKPADDPTLTRKENNGKEKINLA